MFFLGRVPTNHGACVSKRSIVCRSCKLSVLMQSRPSHGLLEQCAVYTACTCTRSLTRHINYVNERYLTGFYPHSFKTHWQTNTKTEKCWNVDLVSRHWWFQAPFVCMCTCLQLYTTSFVWGDSRVHWHLFIVLITTGSVAFCICAGYCSTLWCAG